MEEETQHDTTDAEEFEDFLASLEDFTPAVRNRSPLTQ
jgi:hypothetical protein